MLLHELIQKRLHELSMTQEQLHAAVLRGGYSITRQGVNHWCTGATHPARAVWETLASTLGLTVVDIALAKHGLTRSDSTL